MKNKLLFTFLFIIINQVIFSQNEEETINFINTKLTAHTASLPNNKFLFQFSTKKNDYNGKKEIVVEFFSNYKLSSTDIFYPEHINDVQMFRAENGNLCIKLISSRNMIIKKYTFENNSTHNYELRIVLNTTDEEVNRIKKAIIHLLELNNAKLIDDNMFKN